jgi:orotate phosphoribosyltransferase
MDRAGRGEVVANMIDLCASLPVRRGHFLLESGYHTDLWITLDALFADAVKIAPLVTALADRLRPYDISGVCGSLVGGAFLAQALATSLGVEFYFAEKHGDRAASGLFTADYRLPSALRQRIRGRRVAVVDDVISAGSSVRATVADASAAGATIAVVASLLILGDAALTYFAERTIPMETLERRDFNLWKPSDCPLCARNAPLEDCLAVG